MKLGSLFSGVGGLDMAVHAAFGDITTAWVSDFDTGPNKILAHRYPDVPNIGDLTQIDWTQVEPVDIIAGGFPCQDVSLAGRRAGMTEGTRSNLWGAMRTAIETIRPRYVVAENVRGLLSATANSVSDMEPGGGPLGNAGADNLRALGRVLGDLADLGYDAGWCGLRASDVGAPHGRFRVFIVAEDSLRGRSGGRAGVASDSASERADAPAHRPDSRPDPSRQREVALLPTPNTMDHLPARTGDAREKALHRGGETSRRATTGNLREEIVNLLPTPRATRGGSHTETAQLLPTPTASEGNGIGVHGTGSADLRTTIALLPTPKAGDADMGFPRTSGRPPEMSTHLATRIHYTDFGTYTPAIERWEHILGRPAPAPTEPNGKHRPRLSARFVEFMMGLPEGWVTDTPGITRNEALKALGNGVVPLQCEAALRHLQEVRDAYM